MTVHNKSAKCKVKTFRSICHFALFTLHFDTGDQRSHRAQRNFESFLRRPCMSHEIHRRVHRDFVSDGAFYVIH
jgi:hypothetical protein